jgi:broad specificity phosphatase PhoE
VSRIYLVRHGQAGTRKSYDNLSELGRRQARLLGEYFAKEGIRFAAAISGGLRRQQQTAEEVRAACPEFPEIAVDEGWNEFDLDHVYRELAPVLCEEDAEFRSEFEAMLADAGADRRWTASDLKIVKAWIRGHERFRGETWTAFRERITACRAGLPELQGEDRNLIVFTSATPIGIWAALGMDVEDHRAMRLAGVLHNASFTVIGLREREVRLHMFNASPHLEPSLRTYR